MFLNQQSYVRSILKRFGMEDCKLVKTPLVPGSKFTKLTGNEECVDQIMYQQSNGCLTYAMTTSRLDLLIAFSILSQYMSNHRKQHWDSVKHVLRYLKGTINRGLCYSKEACDTILKGSVLHVGQTA